MRRRPASLRASPAACGRRRDRRRPSAARPAARRGAAIAAARGPRSRIRKRSRPRSTMLYRPSASCSTCVITPLQPIGIDRRPSLVVLLPARAAAAPSRSCGRPRSRPPPSSRYRGSKMCSGRNTLGKRTTFGSGKRRRSDMFDLRLAIAIIVIDLKSIAIVTSGSSSSSCPCSPSARTGRACRAS